SRFVSAQLLAYVESGVWRRNAERANAFARSIGQAAGSRLLHPVEANEVFVELGVAGKASLRAAGFEFYDWGSPASGAARLVASWDQNERHVEALCAALTAIFETNLMPARESRMLALGTPAPDFVLADPSGKRFALRDFVGSSGLLVAFICNHCPFVKHLLEGFVEF